MVNLAIINGSGVGDTDYDEKSFLKISNITTSSGTNTRYDNEVTLFKTIYNNKSAVERFFVRESLNPTHDNDVVEKTTDELYDSLKSSLDRELITPYLGEFYYYELDNCENEWERNDKKIKDIKAYIEKLISYDEYNNYLHRILLVISLGMNVALILHELIK
jgi:viroplasmin and RNaseH domain-containing protein